MFINIHLAKSTFKHFIHASYWRGHGVHSPFVYHLVRHIITTRKVDKALREKTRSYRDALLSDKTVINVTDLGTGAGRNVTRSVCSIAKNASVTEKYGMLLARLVEEYAPRNIIELGTSLGISTQYMARKLAGDTHMISIEGCPSCAAIAAKQLKSAGLDKVDLRVGNFDDMLPAVMDEVGEPGFVFIDGNHTYEATMRYFNVVAKRATSKTIIAFDDIHWSPDMSKAWDEIVVDERVMTSVDMLHLGLVFFRQGCQKEFYRLRW
ncbi:MAG: class I SAM-dependent methyltransferase [Bacteroidales bacterium]|nr:class I SAM-dependent methyltransferase [Bacteroidales bacterium]